MDIANGEITFDKRFSIGCWPEFLENSLRASRVALPSPLSEILWRYSSNFSTSSVRRVCELRKCLIAACIDSDLWVECTPSVKWFHVYLETHCFFRSYKLCNHFFADSNVFTQVLCSIDSSIANRSCHSSSKVSKIQHLVFYRSSTNICRTYSTFPWHFHFSD